MSDEEEHRPLLWAFYIFLLVMVFLIISSYVKEAADDNLHKQKVLAINLALLHDSVLIGENAYAEYSIEENFTIKFDTVDKCFFSVKHEESEIPSIFECKKTRYDSSSLIEFNNPGKIIFNKTGDDFRVKFI